MASPKNKVSGVPGTDPTLPRVEIELGGKKYFLCFTFAALAIAQKRLRDAGIDCNILHALDLSAMDITRVVPLLFAALITYKPDITYPEAEALVTLKNLGKVFEGIASAYVASLGEPDAEEAIANPEQPE
jgi:hypothetical protein